MADGLDADQVPADAKWVIHFDLDVARQSEMGKAVHARLIKEERIRRALERMQDDFGFDPTKDLHSATFYGNRFAAQRGVAVIELAHIDHDKLVARLKKDKPLHSTIQHADHTIYTWAEVEGNRHEYQVSGSLFGDGHLVFSRDVEQLARALDVLDGKAAGLPEESALRVGAAPGAVLIARAVGMAGQETPFRSPVMRDARQLSMTVGEVDGDVFMQGMLVADSGETALQIRSIVEGFHTLAQLQAAGDPLAKKVMGGLKLVVADATIAGEWRAPSKDVLQLMDTMQKKYRERANRRGQERPPEDADGD